MLNDVIAKRDESMDKQHLSCAEYLYDEVRSGDKHLVIGIFPLT